MNVWAARIAQFGFQKGRDDAEGVYIYDATNSKGPAGPTIDPAKNPPNSTDGGDYAPYMVERFISVQNNTLTLYYTMATWNPYTIVLMKSDFSIVPRIDPASLVHTKNTFAFSWSGPTNTSYQAEYSTNLVIAWATFTNIITSTNGTFNFTDYKTNRGGFSNSTFYRLRTWP
jgi:hypothetical protein